MYQLTALALLLVAATALPTANEDSNQDQVKSAHLKVNSEANDLTNDNNATSLNTLLLKKMNTSAQETLRKTLAEKKAGKEMETIDNDGVNHENHADLQKYVRHERNAFKICNIAVDTLCKGVTLIDSYKNDGFTKQCVDAAKDSIHSACAKIKI